MGYGCRENNVLLLLAALEQCLASQGAKITPGAGVSAANKIYQG
jgi:aspartate aminotransferase-like enzyme